VAVSVTDDSCGLQRTTSPRTAHITNVEQDEEEQIGVVGEGAAGVVAAATAGSATAAAVGEEVISNSFGQKATRLIGGDPTSMLM
jgi:hypothetical protein